MPNVKTDEESGPQWAGRITGGTNVGNLSQTRFQRIPATHLSRETIAGVRDMNLGRIKNGEPVGAPTIRFDSGKNTGNNPHINIDPLGRASASNPHIEVPSGVIETAKVVNKTLKYAGITLCVAAVAMDSYRIVKSFMDDCNTKEHADEIIEKLEASIQTLTNLLETETDPNVLKEIKATIQHLKEVLDDVKRTKKIPVKCIKTCSSVGGGWAAGFAGGWAGAVGGAETGALIGTCFGPVGTVVGAPIGAVVGSIVGGISGGILGSVTGEAIAKEVIKNVKIDKDE